MRFQPLVLLGAVPLILALNIDFDIADSTPDPIHTVDQSAPSQITEHNATAIASPIVTIVKIVPTPTIPKQGPVKTNNSACASRLSSAKSGPIPTQDTDYAFLNSPEIKSLATNASTPPGYRVVFQNLHASSSGDGFLGFDSLDTYDTNRCAKSCDEKDDCVSVNVFFERAPTLDVGPECPNPPSTTQIKCAFWGGPINTAHARNHGYTDHSFIVAIAGSNGYVRGTSEDIQGHGGKERVKGSSPAARAIPSSALRLVQVILSTLWLTLPRLDM